MTCELRDGYNMLWQSDDLHTDLQDSLFFLASCNITKEMKEINDCVPQESRRELKSFSILNMCATSA